MVKIVNGRVVNDDEANRRPAPGAAVPLPDFSMASLQREYPLPFIQRPVSGYILLGIIMLAFFMQGFLCFLVFFFFLFFC